MNSLNEDNELNEIWSIAQSKGNQLSAYMCYHRSGRQ